jgi:hypothetical protein
MCVCTHTQLCTLRRKPCHREQPSNQWTQSRNRDQFESVKVCDVSNVCTRVLLNLVVHVDCTHTLIDWNILWP